MVRVCKEKDWEVGDEEVDGHLGVGMVCEDFVCPLQST